MKRCILALSLAFRIRVNADQKPEVWLTPERRESLSQLAKRPYIVSQERVDANTVIYRWTNNVHCTVSTNRIKSILGKPSKNSWQDRLDSKDRENKSLIDDIKAVSAKPTKKDLDSIIKKHSK